MVFNDTPVFQYTVLYLRRHDVERHDRSVCGGRRSTRPYDQLGRVVVSDCFCLVCVDSKLGTILPGNGCDRDTCNIIAQTLRDRQQQQGDGAAATSRWINRQMVDRTVALERKIDVILDHISSRNNNRDQQQQHFLPATGVVLHTAGPSSPPPSAFSMSMSDR
jgi:hypothetical protein